MAESDLGSCGPRGWKSYGLPTHHPAARVIEPDKPIRHWFYFFNENHQDLQVPLGPPP